MPDTFRLNETNLIEPNLTAWQLTKTQWSRKQSEFCNIKLINKYADTLKQLRPQVFYILPTSPTSLPTSHKT